MKNLDKLYELKVGLQHEVTNEWMTYLGELMAREGETKGYAIWCTEVASRVMRSAPSRDYDPSRVQEAWELEAIKTLYVKAEGPWHSYVAQNAREIYAAKQGLGQIGEKYEH